MACSDWADPAPTGVERTPGGLGGRAASEALRLCGQAGFRPFLPAAPAWRMRSDPGVRWPWGAVPVAASARVFLARVFLARAFGGPGFSSLGFGDGRARPAVRRLWPFSRGAAPVGKGFGSRAGGRDRRGACGGFGRSPESLAGGERGPQGEGAAPARAQARRRFPERRSERRDSRGDFRRPAPVRAKGRISLPIGKVWIAAPGPGAPAAGRLSPPRPDPAPGRGRRRRGPRPGPRGRRGSGRCGTGP